MNFANNMKDYFPNSSKNLSVMPPATGDSAQLGANHGKLEITNGQVFFISDEGQKTPLGPEGQVKMQHSNFHNQEWWEIFTPKSLR